jgi:hypothetical protein
VIKRHQERYPDFGPTFACEKLAEDGLVLSPDSLVVMIDDDGRQVRGIRGKREWPSGSACV